MQRHKIVLVSDHPLVSSGVGSQSKYLIEGLLATGKYKFFCLGGAIKHAQYNMQCVEPEKFGQDGWIILPVDGHGSKEVLRQVLDQERPDAVVLFTDPRFFYWAWEMEDEIRQVCPLLYWHVWDNDPAPEYNRTFYESTDRIGCISLKTDALLTELGYDRHEYIPHGLPSELFKPLPDDQIEEFKRKNIAPFADRKFFAFWNNRNARRKQTGDVIVSFSRFAHRVGKQNVALIMHTAPNDQEGQDVLAVAKKFDVQDCLIVSPDRVNPEVLNSFYNVADVTMNLSSNEGFGLGTLESLFSGTPILAHFTGGLQYQLGDWWEKLPVSSLIDQDEINRKMRNAFSSKKPGMRWWGVPVFPAARLCTGSQQIPYIYDDKASNDDAARGLEFLYGMGRQKRKELGLAAREWATSRFSLDKMVESWDRMLSSEIERFLSGSRRGYRVAAV